MTSKNINLDTVSLESLIKSLKQFQTDTAKMVNDTAKESAEIGRDYAENLFASYNPDKTIGTDIDVSIKNTPGGYNIVASGKDVLYTEFGTGDKGAADPHPVKNTVGLNAYNSGPTIKTAKNGSHYWRYEYAPHKFVTSHGNPSGKQMWMTSIELKENIIPKVLARKEGEALSKL